MSEVLFHAARRDTAELADRLRTVLKGLDHPRAAGLANRVTTEVHDRPRLVFTGQYSSGKSSLIKALTDGAADVVIDSDIATDSVREYDWDGLVALVDTPGVQAGVDRHDMLAEQAIASADLVLFAVTPDLFDDAAVDHLHHVADDLEKHEQLLLVITMASRRRAATGVREAEVRNSLGPAFSGTPLVECDAQDYLRGLTEAESERASQYRALSNLDGLRDAINDIGRRRGDLARYQQPLQNIGAIALEAEALITEDPDEGAALALLARQRAALTARRERIDATLNDQRSTFLTDSVRAAESFVDSIESVDDNPTGAKRDSQIEKFSATLNRDLTNAFDRMAQAVTREMQVQFDDLASEVREIEASPHARIVLDLAQGSVVPTQESDIRVDAPHGSTRTSQSVPAWSQHAAQWLKEFQLHWGAGASGSGLKASSGSVGHKVVLDFGHFLGAKFDPWQAVRVADRIGRAARIASGAITVVVALGSTIEQERRQTRAEQQRSKRRADLVQEVRHQAEQIVDGTLSKARAHLDSVFQDAYDQIDAVHAEIQAARTSRSATSQELAAIRGEATRVVRELTAAS